ncbi:MAG: UTP--glucose-1-phosphate uridylyltransferase GalU [Parvibaculaceae bacterium]|nr:UTP--glucose-1-phosphate uridylyltransferase GalU [Parvibaculaceae bacterium]
MSTATTRKKVRTVVFPVAGLGTRFLPATKVVPKEMLTVVDKPLIQYAVEEAREAGIEHFVFITGRGKGAMEDHFDLAFELDATLQARNKLAEIELLKESRLMPGTSSFVRQQEPLGLGHAVWCARDIVGDNPFAVILPDDLVHAEKGCLAQMVEAYEQVGGNIVAVENVPREDVYRYGVLNPGVETGALVEVKGLVEKPKVEEAPSTLSIIGRYILQPGIFSILEKGQRGAGGEIQLTDGMAQLIGGEPFHGLRFKGTRYDCGDKVGFLHANVAYGLARPDIAAKFGPALKSFLAGKL